MKSIADLCKQLGSPDQVLAYQARRDLDTRVAEAGKPGNDAVRAELAAALAAALVASQDGKDSRGRDAQVGVYGVATRREIAQALALVAGEAEVASLAQALDDFDVRESARFALDRCPLAAATDVLCQAAGSAVGTEFVVGVVNALGRRQGSNVVAALKKCIDSNAVEVRLAAAEALANFPDASVDELIANVRRGGGTSTGSRGGVRVQRARLRLADTLAAAGQTDAAKGIYQALTADDKEIPPAQRKAAAAALARMG